MDGCKTDARMDRRMDSDQQHEGTGKHSGGRRASGLVCISANLQVCISANYMPTVYISICTYRQVCESAGQQANKSAGQQARKSASQQASQEVSKPVGLHVCRSASRYRSASLQVCGFVGQQVSKPLQVDTPAAQPASHLVPLSVRGCCFRFASADQP